MNFSMAKMMIVVCFVSVVLAATFAMPPLIGWIVLSVISLMFLPPFIWIGLLNTRGRKQAFFLGAMMSGIPHFLLSLYLFLLLLLEQSWSNISASDPEIYLFLYAHPICYALGALGGLGGVLSHMFIIGTPAEGAEPKLNLDHDQPRGSLGLSESSISQSSVPMLPK